LRIIARSKSQVTLPAAGEDSPLLERAGELATLDKSLTQALAGSGSIVLVSGEAGVGKTALVRAFCHARRGGVRVLWGACDPLFTPRPLGPLFDVAEVVGGELAELVEAEARPHDVTMALRREIGRRPPMEPPGDDRGRRACAQPLQLGQRPAQVRGRSGFGGVA
jgi:AAA ATPase domain